MKKTGFIIVLAVMFMFSLPFNLFAADGEFNTAKLVAGSGGKVGVMPFMAGKFHTNMDDIVEKTISCNISQLCFEPQDFKIGGEATLTKYVMDYLKNRMEPAALIPVAEVTEAYNAIYTDENKDTIRSLAVRFGKSINADYVLAGTVWRYRDRSQTEDEFERPASVAFVSYLVEVSSGKRMWKGYSDKSQGALSEDLSNAPLFFKGGVKWLTANELAKIAVKETFKKFPFEMVRGVALNDAVNTR